MAFREYSREIDGTVYEFREMSIAQRRKIAKQYAKDEDFLTMQANIVLTSCTTLADSKLADIEEMPVSLFDRLYDICDDINEGRDPDAKGKSQEKKQPTT